MRTALAISSAAAVVACAGSASGALIQSTALGSDMAGGRVTVFFHDSSGMPLPAVSAPIVAAAGDTGTATGGPPVPVLGSWTFRVSGDTYLNPWILDNQTDFHIHRVEINLHNTISLFDDQSPPDPLDTPGSFSGRDGVVHVSGPLQLLADEFDPWAQLKNTGDLWHQEFINWPFFTFGGFQTYTWQDDTDIIPAPGAAAVLGLAGLVIGRRRRA